jgi:hypothetical protein
MEKKILLAGVSPLLTSWQNTPAQHLFGETKGISQDRKPSNQDANRV